MYQRDRNIGKGSGKILRRYLLAGCAAAASLLIAANASQTDLEAISEIVDPYEGEPVSSEQIYLPVYWESDLAKGSCSPINLYSEKEVEAVAKTVYGEAAVTRSDLEMSAVVWCILNRVDSKDFPNTILEAVTSPKQFHGYNEANPVEEHIENLVRDVLDRWAAEKSGQEDVGRTLPQEYLYFWGDGRHNHFTIEYHGPEEWDWSLPNPYEN